MQFIDKSSIKLRDFLDLVKFGGKSPCQYEKDNISASHCERVEDFASNRQVEPVLSID